MSSALETPTSALFIEEGGQGGLGAVDLGGEERFVADRTVEQPIHRRDESGHTREPGQREFGLPVQVGERLRR